LHQTGEIAIWTLGAGLSLTPFCVLFPHSRVVNVLNRHRRVIGVSACIYGLLHFTCHILYEGGWDALLPQLFETIYLAGYCFRLFSYSWPVWQRPLP
jgi:DMSO/TMAO reductase YedYZ heme-binding membrane subunit